MVERRLPPIEDLEAALRDLARPHRSSARRLTCRRRSWLRLTAVDAPPPRRPRWLAVVVAAVLTWSSCSAFPAPRQAVADWLGIGAVRVVRTDAGPRRHRLQSSGSAARSPSSEAREPRAVHDPRSLDASGRRPSIYAGEPSADSVTLLWGPADRTCPRWRPRASACCSPRCRDPPIARSIEKQLGPGTTPRDRRRSATTRRTGSPGASTSCSTWTETAGRGLDTTRLAANTLLWEARWRDVPPRVAGWIVDASRSSWPSSSEPACPDALAQLLLADDVEGAAGLEPLDLLVAEGVVGLGSRRWCRRACGSCTARACRGRGRPGRAR